MDPRRPDPAPTTTLLGPGGDRPEALDEHLARVGPLPTGGAWLVDTLERSDLRGRGGAAFPVGTKWRSVATGSRGRAAVVVNGAEGEPLSRKDRVLMETRPHLVLDGAALAAESVGAREVILYVGSDHTAAQRSLAAALRERSHQERRRTRLVAAPARYVSGEETAAVHYIDAGVPLPTTTPPRPYERGVGGRPTLVQNVESLAHAALVARFGDAWFRAQGRGDAAGTVLLTVVGAVRRRGVVEVPQGMSVADAVALAGGTAARVSAVLLGGYFGGWVAADRAWSTVLDAPTLRAQGLALGCGVVAVLPEQRCGLVETARIVAYLAGESARQCGPCVFGLRAIAGAVDRIATGRSDDDDLERVRRWTGELPGRGACRHPDGAAGLTRSALVAFADEVALHHEHRRCSAATAVAA